MDEYELARDCFTAYATAMWAGYLNPKHVATLADHLEQVESGDIKRLIVSMPPRHSKSLNVGQFFPAWYLGKHPDQQIIYTTYSQQQASKFGRLVRNQLLDPTYNKIFPKCHLSQDSKSKHELNTLEGGVYNAIGRGSSITGKGSNCLIGETLIFTDKGCISIKNLHLVPISCKILGYDTIKKKFVFQKAKAIKRSKTTRIFRFTTTRGRVVEATEEHLFFVNGQYKKANELAPGDNFVCILWKNENEGSLRIFESQEVKLQRQILFKDMQSSTSCNKKQTSMQNMQFSSRKEGKDLLQQLQTKIKWQKSNKKNKKNNCLSSVQQLISKICLSTHKTTILLFKDLCKPWTFIKNVCQRQPKMEKWCKCEQKTITLCESISGNEDYNLKEGQLSLCNLQKKTNNINDRSCASYRQQSHEQSGKKSCNSMCEMSQKMACSLGLETEIDIVARVEIVYKDAFVYDLETDNQHNFFANGILVHNCMIIDDILKDEKEAESKLIRENIKDWYRTVASTRLQKDAKVILCGTRWHEDDLIGWALNELKDQNWTVLNFPALDNNNQPLWPEMFNENFLEQARKTLGSYFWNALYMGRPSPRKGNLFWRDSFKFYTMIPPKFDIQIQSWDATFKKTQSGSYVVGHVWGKLGTNCYLLGHFRERVDFVKTLKEIVALTSAYPKATIKLIEDKANGPAIISILCNRVPGITPIEPEGSKYARACEVSEYQQAGHIYLPHPSISPWVNDYIDEMCVFDKGTNDDEVDASTQAWSYLYGAQNIIDKLKALTQL